MIIFHRKGTRVHKSGKVLQLPFVNEAYKKESTGGKGTSFLKLKPKMYRDIGFYIY